MRLYLVFWRWEEERYPEGIKWKFLEHKGPVFAPPYEPLPESVKFYYDGELFTVIQFLDKKRDWFYLGIESEEGSCAVYPFVYFIVFYSLHSSQHWAHSLTFYLNFISKEPLCKSY